MNQLTLIPQGEQLMAASEHWCLTRDGDPRGYELYQAHYARRNYLEQRQRLFAGPGRKLVLLSKDGAALFVWRLFKDAIQPPQAGFNCAVFRNEGTVRSSELIREAVEIVFMRWGRDRCYTLVDGRKVRSTNPGCCFKKAGWRRCGTSKGGKLIFCLEADWARKNASFDGFDRLTGARIIAGGKEMEGGGGES